MTEQFEMKRTQYVSFTEEEAKSIDKFFDVVQRHTDNKKRLSINKFVKQETIARANSVLGENDE